MSDLFTPSVAKIVTVQETPQGLPNVLKFDNSAINSAIDAAMKSIPADKHVVAIARVDMSGARLTIAGRIPSGTIPGELDWTVFVDKPWQGEFDAGLGVRWSI
jgi:hypothetical protein